MESVKYIGLDVHQSTISVAVLNAEGKLLMQSVIATKATAVLDLMKGLRGALHVTFEEGTYSAWLYDVVLRHVEQVVVCNPRKNALLKSGNKSDQIDARKLAELLRAGMKSVDFPADVGPKKTVIGAKSTSHFSMLRKFRTLNLLSICQALVPHLPASRIRNRNMVI
jgi:transposase